MKQSPKNSIFFKNIPLCIVLVLLLGLISSCSVRKHLKKDEYLVRKVKFDFTDDTHIENKNQLSEKLKTQLIAKPNKNWLLFFPREWFFLRNRDNKDSSRVQMNFVQKIIAEKPAFYTPEIAAQTKDRLKLVLQNKGFFNATVSEKIDTTRGRFLTTTYALNLKKPFLLSRFNYNVQDSAIYDLLQENKAKSHLVIGKPVSNAAYNAEVNRIVTLLRNTGYAYFFSNSISSLKADSIGQNVEASLNIRPSTNNKTFQKFKIGDVYVFPDADPLATENAVSVDTTVNEYRIIYRKDKISVNPKTLANNIYLVPGKTYKQADYNKTTLQLNSLGIFRYVNIEQEINSSDSTKIDFYLSLSQNPKIEFGTEANLTFTDRIAVTNSRLSLIGGSASASISNNNALGGGEKLSLSVNGGVEFNLADITNKEIQRLNTVEVGGIIQYDIPRFLDFLGLYKKLSKIKSGTNSKGEKEYVIPPHFYHKLKERATTSLSLSANYVDLLNFYSTERYSGLYGYRLRYNPQTRYTINHLGLEYFNTNTKDIFNEILDDNPFLQRSFGDQVLTGLLFKNISYEYKQKPKKLGYWNILFDFEQSGFEVYMVNKAYNFITRSGEPFSLYASNDTIDYSRFVRWFSSFAYTIPLSSKNSIAFRGMGGIGTTFGFFRKEVDLPFVRQFYSGGNSSMRGWQARSIGPGAYIDTFAINNPTRVAKYQQGSFKLELNAEFRQYLVGFRGTRLEGAIFADIGNIWTLKNDSARPFSKFAFKNERNDNNELIATPFYNQLGMNTGVGLRLDVNYVLFRLDVGAKLRNPYKINGSYWPNNFGDGNLKRLNWTIGLNYPF